MEDGGEELIDWAEVIQQISRNDYRKTIWGKGDVKSNLQRTNRLHNIKVFFTPIHIKPKLVDWQ